MLMVATTWSKWVKVLKTKTKKTEKLADIKNKFYKLGIENEMLKSKITDWGIGYDARAIDETRKQWICLKMHAEQIPEFIFI